MAQGQTSWPAQQELDDHQAPIISSSVASIHCEICCRQQRLERGRTET
jgi:hypothetical protein